jgi:type III secretion protein L
MVIWLRGDNGPLGLGADVLRREQLAQVLELDQGWQAIEQRGAALLADARARAQAIVAAAEGEADAIVADAERRTANSARLGYAAGRQQALNDHHARMRERVRGDQAALAAMRERLTAIVYQAVQKLLACTARDGLFQRAAEMVGAEIEQASFLSVTVHPDDAYKVRQLFGEAGWTVRPTIIEDAGAGVGACLCEWDAGVLDAGLPAQLAALRKSLRQALETVAAADAGDVDDAAAAAAANAADSARAAGGGRP